MDAPASNHPRPPQGTPRPGIHIPPNQGKVVDVPNPDHLSPGIPPSLPKQGKAVDVPNPNPDPVLFPDIPPSLPHLPVPDTVGAPHTSDSVPPSSSTTTDTGTHDTETSSPAPAPAPAPSPSTTTDNTPRPSPTPAPTTSSIPPSDSEPSPADSETVHLSTRIVSSSSRFIRPTVSGPSTLTVPNDDLIPSSSSLIYPTDNGSQGNNPNNGPTGDGNVGGGGNPSKAAEQRGFSTGAVVGIVISLIILCFVGFVFWRRRQRQARRTEHANRWWFSRTRRLPEGYMYNAPERPPTVYSSSFGSSFERTRSNSLMSSDEFDGSSTRPPMMEVNPFGTTTTPSLSLGPTSHSPADSELYGPHSLTTVSDSQFFARPDSESSYNETILPSSVHLPSSPPSESSTIHPQRPPSPKYNSSSFSRTSSGRSLALLPNSPTTRVFIPPIPPLPKSPPPIPMSNPFMDHNPFEDPVHH